MGKLMASSSKQQKVKKKSSVLISFQSNKENGVYFKRAELRKYLDLLTNDVNISKFLEYDTCRRLADNYLLALVFVYFKRSGLSVADYTYTNFFAALLLAHAMVEENEGFLDEIFHWALPHCAYDRFLVRQLESLKFLMFQAMGYKGAVSRFCLENVMSAVNHPFWSRERNCVHAGTAYRRGLRFVSDRSEKAYNSLMGSCKECRKARSKLLEVKDFRK